LFGQSADKARDAGLGDDGTIFVGTAACSCGDPVTAGRSVGNVQGVNPCQYLLVISNRAHGNTPKLKRRVFAASKVFCDFPFGIIDFQKTLTFNLVFFLFFFFEFLLVKLIAKFLSKMFLKYMNRLKALPVMSWLAICALI
jgi:hypothetical protein